MVVKLKNILTTGFELFLKFKTTKLLYKKTLSSTPLFIK